MYKIILVLRTHNKSDVDAEFCMSAAALHYKHYEGEIFQFSISLKLITTYNRIIWGYGILENYLQMTDFLQYIRVSYIKSINVK